MIFTKLLFLYCWPYLTPNGYVIIEFALDYLNLVREDLLLTLHFLLTVTV